MFKKYIFFIAAALAILVSLILISTASADDASEPDKEGLQSKYVGSATCARCHANTYATFSQTWHPNMLRRADDTNVLGDFDNQDPDLVFTRDEVQWVLGGQYKQRYLTEVDGELFVLLSEWNIQTQDWTAYVTGEWIPYEGQIWRNRPYSRYCAGCHTTGFDPVSQTWVEPGVGCEACHGPGADHVASTGNRTRIVNPARLDFKEQAEVCAQCHSRGTDPSGDYPYPVGYHPGGPAKLNEAFVLSTNPDDFWPDGTVKRHHMQFQDWQQGVHKDSVSCIFCHTSHSPGETDHQTRMVDNDRCLVCHQNQADLAEHIPFMASALDQVNCTDCHMPQVSKFVVSDFQILSHTFRPPNPALSIAYGGQEQMPNACNICHADKNPEWAAAVLGQEIPTTLATRVPLPTPLPVSTQVVPVANISGGGGSASLPQASSGFSNAWLWGISLLALVGGFAYFLWRRRKVSLT